jgi:hypothetical protein
VWETDSSSQHKNQGCDDGKSILIEQRAEIKGKMEEMQKTLDLLNYKISYYENVVLKAEHAIVE